MIESQFGRYLNLLDSMPSLRWSGRVVEAHGNLIESDGPLCSLGECCEIADSSGHIFPGEVVGLRGTRVLSMLLDHAHGIRYGNRVTTCGTFPHIAVGDALIGRVLNATGNPMDGRGPLHCHMRRSLTSSAPDAMRRSPIRDPLGCGVRSIDSFLTCGRGQRMGIFGGSGVGKSTLMGMMARGTSADLTVVALIGERGREVREFLEDALGEEGLQRSIVVVSTSDQSPLLRIRAAMAATAIAEHFCERGKNILLVLDSITRFAMAQREVGLAAGEPPTAKGYTPSVFSMLARLVERAGNIGSGSITAFYTVLMEGDDHMDPIVDSVRSLLDGHIMLDRRLTSGGHYPPINVLESLSRLMPAVCTAEHLAKAAAVRELLAIYARSEDLVRIGAYQKGADLQLDHALDVVPKINEFLRQRSLEKPSLSDSVAQLLTLPS